MPATRGRMTIDLPNIVRNARMMDWPAERLVQSFNNMSIEIAQDLLAGRLGMNPDGSVYIN